MRPAESAHQFLAQRGCDLGAEHLDRFHELRMRQRGRVHLKGETRDAAQRFTVSNDLLCDFLRIANQQRTLRTSLSVEISASDGTPAALFPNVSERASVARKEIISGLLRRRRDIAERVHTDFESIRGVSRTPARFPVEIDERAEPVRMPTNDGNHQRKTEHAGSDKGLRSPANAQPYGYRIL